jgi:hypothetical protein
MTAGLTTLVLLFILLFTMFQAKTHGNMTPMPILKNYCLYFFNNTNTPPETSYKPTTFSAPPPPAKLPSTSV